MSTFQPPPTYALPVIQDETTGKSTFNPIWLNWFLQVAQYISNNGGGTSTVAHNSLSGLQGGAASERYHLTLAQESALTAGFSGTGNLVRATGAAFTDTPTVGNANALAVSSVSLTNSAGTAAGTLSNAPVAGNPTKWIQINDNGVTRRVPTW